MLNLTGLLAQTVGMLDIVVVLAYLLIVVYLGYLGWRRTKSAADYLLAGRKAHPVVMALSYGSTFISTSAIVGFGGVAAMFGMSLLWLTFMNIFVGIFIAFVFVGGPTRRMGHRLDAHTFPELIGRRYDSRFLQMFTGLIIFLAMPLYAAAVLIGGTEFFSAQFHIPYGVALLIFSVITAAYVLMGGLKGVMYTDAFQGAIMLIGMLFLLFWCYSSLGGVTQAHQDLSEMSKMPSLFGKLGFKGWTATPTFGFGGIAANPAANTLANPDAHNLWWIVISTIVMGVGIGVLAQPQLAVRFMTVKSTRELNRAVGVGGFFILCMTGVAFTVGALSNVYFNKKEVITGKIVNTTEKVDVFAKRERGLEVPVSCKLLHIDTSKPFDDKEDTVVVAQGYDKLTPEGKVAAPFSKLMPRATVTDKGGGVSEIRLANCNSFTRTVVYNEKDHVWMFNTDSIIPTYISSAMPRWFGTLFMLTLLAAAMSTLSSQFHALGTSLGRDLYGVKTGKMENVVYVTKIGIVIGLIVATILGYSTRGGFIVARATSIFFGLCASTFLPAFIGGLLWKRATKAGAIASMFFGCLSSLFWLVFINDKEARALGLCHALTGKYSLLLTKPSWPVVDQLFISLPVSIAVFVLVCLLTRRPEAAHVEHCFAADRQVRRETVSV